MLVQSYFVFKILIFQNQHGTIKIKNQLCFYRRMEMKTVNFLLW